MEILNRSYLKQKSLPIKVVQFGDGNFLRGFADYIIDLLNDKGFNAGVAVVKNRPGNMTDIILQQGLFTLFTEGIDNGTPVREHRIISCIQKIVNPYEDYNAFLKLAEEPELKIILSNTTEAGIYFDEGDTAFSQRPHRSFAAKLTALLYIRYVYFKGDIAKGCIVLPCELIENNAKVLNQMVLQYCNAWKLENEFKDWLSASCTFCNTLVDRIVSGYPKKNTKYYTSKLDYTDTLITVCEPYLFWAIEADETLLKDFPLHSIDKNIILVNNLAPYRNRKVRILNGAHTMLAQISRLAGLTTVSEAMENIFCKDFISGALKDEILPTVNLPYDECIIYTDEVLSRFRNPYLEHNLSDIALNSVSKFKARLMPVIEEYYALNKSLPPYIIYSLACLFHIYKGTNRGSVIELRDDEAVLQTFSSAWQLPDYESTVDTVIDILFTGYTLPYDELKIKLTRALTILDTHRVEEGVMKLNT